MISTSSLPLTGLASHLVQDGLLNTEIAYKALCEAKRKNISLIQYLTENNIVNSHDILHSCAKSFDLPIFNIDHYDTAWLIDSPLSHEIILRYRVIPLKKYENSLQVGLSDPTDRHTIEAIAFYTGLIVNLTLIAEEQLNRFIETNCSQSSKNKNLELSLLNEISQEENHQTIQESIAHYEEPLIQFVDQIIQNAFKKSATDIHIESHEKTCRIRYRQDSMLYDIAAIPINLASRLVTRLKVMAKLDISERRLPQDGRFQLNTIDIRISTCPTLHGEKIVLRLLDIKKISLDIHSLGLTELQKNIFLKKITRPQGLILVTGPTGSGKTVTLYSALQYLNTSEKNISTVEDPIEIQLNGINQVQINTKIGLHFSTALRAFLRQDPDVIMVGEIRDTETAEIAVQAAQTGHLVLSTLHTNSAIESIIRLRSIGVPSYNIISSLSLIIAQRLVRKLCTYCKQSEIIPTQALQNMGFSFNGPAAKIYRAVGCEHCSHGYDGRVGIYEFLSLNNTLSQLIMANKSIAHITEQACQEGFISLRQSGLEKILQGITSLTEVNRVIQQ